MFYLINEVKTLNSSFLYSFKCLWDFKKWYFETIDLALSGLVTLPETLSGTFIWKGKNLTLKGGLNRIEVKDQEVDLLESK